MCLALSRDHYMNRCAAYCGDTYTYTAVSELFWTQKHDMNTHWIDCNVLLWSSIKNMQCRIKCNYSWRNCCKMLIKVLCHNKHHHRYDNAGESWYIRYEQLANNYTSHLQTPRNATVTILHWQSCLTCTANYSKAADTKLQPMPSSDTELQITESSSKISDDSKN